jgi:hypothetical protein
MAMFNQQYTKAVAITASDSVDFPKQGTSDNLCSAIYVGGAGVVPVVFQDGSVVNFTCAAGQILPVKARRVNSTNLGASLLVALYAL